MKQQITPDFEGDYQRTEDAEQLPNPERGCGFLKAGNAYIRADTGRMGVLPRFVLFTDDQGDLWPIPYKESMPRGYMFINGTDWLTAAESIRLVEPMGYDVPTEAHVASNALYDSEDDVPSSEVQRHIDRVADDGIPSSQSHFGIQDSAQSKDVLMRAGETHYPDPWDFIDEAYSEGLNKGINVSENQRPPHISPGRTRVFIIHPNAMGDSQPGIVGFSYATRVVYTKDTDGDVPSYAQDDADAGKMDIVEVGEPEPREGDIAERHASILDYGPQADTASQNDDSDDGGDFQSEDMGDFYGDDSGSESAVPAGCPNGDCLGTVERDDDGFGVCSECRLVFDLWELQPVDCPRDRCNGHAMEYVDRPGIKFRCDTDGQGIAQDYVKETVGTAE